MTENQRDRITAAVISEVGRRGYRETRITDICTAAGISRRTFYERFTSKEDCFFATYNLVATYLRDAASDASAGERSWPKRVRARLGSALDVFAENPDLALFTLTAPPRAGEEIAARFRVAMDEVLAQLTGDMPKALARKRLPRTAHYALIGGGVALIVQQVEAGEGARLPELLPDLTQLALTPYLGPAEAAKVARED